MAIWLYCCLVMHQSWQTSLWSIFMCLHTPLIVVQQLIDHWIGVSQFSDLPRIDDGYGVHIAGQLQATLLSSAPRQRPTGLWSIWATPKGNFDGRYGRWSSSTNVILLYPIFRDSEKHEKWSCNNMQCCNNHCHGVPLMLIQHDTTVVSYGGPLQMWELPSLYHWVHPTETPVVQG